jgi:aryl-alcohol dehydrogenase-like predicted oxidoreductase
LLTGRFALGQPRPDESVTFRHGSAHTFPEARLQQASRFTALAQEWGVAPPALALAWLLRRPGVTSAIVGSATIEQLEQTALAPEVVLSTEQLETLDGLA